MNRTRNQIVLLLTILAVCEVAAAIDGADAMVAEPGLSQIDFQNDLIPVFTKNGCNTGACHGAAIGRGGFQLSLYGGDPKSDYQSIVQQLAGRRINLSKPDQSLIVLKPAEFIAHGGGTIFDPDSSSAELLTDWIRQGAHWESSRQLQSVEVSPQKHVIDAIGKAVSFSAVAHYSDGTSRDVTEWTIFTAEDSSAVTIDVESASATILRRGRHIVVARFLSEVVPIELLTPLTDAKLNLADQQQANFIDKEICTTLEILGLPPSETINGTTFLRRVSLDLTGRLPSVKQAQRFANDGSTKAADRRLQLIDELLASVEFNQYWTLQLAKLLRIRTQAGDATAANAYHKWLAEQVACNTPYDDLARALITSAGDSAVLGPPNFYRTVKDAREQTEFFSELFMGSRLRCANCHNHPLDRWTQDDYHGLAAIFAKIEPGRIVKPRPSGQVIHPRTLEPAALRIPGDDFLAADAKDARTDLADWLTAAQNPYFAKAIVNRLWKHMMGRGFVEPVDDFRATNPATHPALLAKMADDFVASGYDLRHTLRTIATSTSYARSANAGVANKDDDRFYSHAARRPLEAEVLADAISDVLEVSEQYGDQTEGTRAVALVDPKTPSQTLDVLGRCGREESCENSAGSVGGLRQQLHLLNGGLLNKRISATGSRLQRLVNDGAEPMAIVTEFYLAALGRQPSKLESRHWKQKLNQDFSAEQRLAFLEDFVWGLLTCSEFVTNH